MPVGQNLKKIRLGLGLSLADIEYASRGITEREGNRDFIIYKSRLSQIEHGSQPGPAKVLVLAEIYGLTTKEMMQLWSPTSAE